MKFDEFLGQAKHRLEISDGGRSLRSVRATLTALGERLQEGEANDLASPLPMEIDRFVTDCEHGQRLSFQAFLDRIAEIEGSQASDAYGHARAVLEVLEDAIPEGEMEDVRASLPDDYQELFEAARSHKASENRS